MATACSFPGPVEPDFFERSPDGLWTASSFDYYPPIRMQVARADGSAAWQVESDGEGWPEVILRPVHWSIDGRYLYFTLAPFVDGFVLYVSGSGLQRLDLNDGRVAQILAGENQLQSFSVSPDSSRVAYVRSDDDIEWLVVRDMGDGTELEWSLADQPVQAGKITWSPDASELVLLVTQGFSNEEALTDLVLVNLGRLSQETVLHEDPRRFYRIQWTDEHTLYLEDLTVTGWRLDLQTGEMVLTPTPIPASQP
jgi:dipeptidyl aminopeptidase/acylaminoacyl peptidase